MLHIYTRHNAVIIGIILQDRSIQLNILRREVDTNRQLYDGLLQRFKEVGVAAGIGGVLASHYFGYVSPLLGGTLLIFAFIVTVIGGMGSLTGAAIASVLVAVLQQFANFYLGVGDLIVVLLLAAVLLVRPQGLLGKAAR